MLAATLFTWLQGADFYRDLHRQAVDSLPEGNGKRWIDIGCGPGLVTRLAVARGYAATGIDTSAGMVKAARRLANLSVRGPLAQSAESYRERGSERWSEFVSSGPVAGNARTAARAGIASTIGTTAAGIS